MLLALAIYLVVNHERESVIDRLTIVSAALANEAQTYLAFDQPGFFHEKAHIYIGSGKAHSVRLYNAKFELVTQVGEVGKDAIGALSPVLGSPDQLLMQPEALDELALNPATLPDDFFETLGYVEASYSLDSYQNRVFWITLWTAGALLFSVLLVITYAYRKTNRRLLDPIRECRDYFKRLTAGDYLAKLPVSTNIAELESLAESANLLSKQLRKNERLQEERIQEQAKHSNELSRALQMSDERRQQDMLSMSQIINNTVKALDEIQAFSTNIASKARNAELTALSRGLSASINNALYTIQDSINLFGESTLQIDSVPRVIGTHQLIDSLETGFNGSRMHLNCAIHFEADVDSICRKNYAALDHQRLLQLLNYLCQNLVEHSINKKVDVSVRNISTDPHALVLQIVLQSQSIFERERVYATHKFFNGEGNGNENLMFSVNQTRIISNLSASLGIDIHCLLHVNNIVSVSLDLHAPASDEPAQLDSLTQPNHMSIVVINNEDFEIEYSHLLRRQGIVIEQYTMPTFKLDERLRALNNPVFFIDATIPIEASHFSKEIYNAIPHAKVVGMIMRHQNFMEDTLDLIDHCLDGLITIPISTPDLVAKAQQVIDIFGEHSVQAILRRVTSEQDD